MKRVLWLLLLLIGTSEVLVAQSFYAARRDRSLIVSGGVGISTYLGDLQDPGNYFDSKLNITGGLQYFVLPNVSVRTDITFFQLRGDDSKSESNSRAKRNLSFVSNNIELDLLGTYQLKPNGTRYYQRSNVNFYGIAGVGLLFSNPTAELNGKRYALQPLQTEGVKYSKFNIVLPVGGGIRFKAGPFLNIGIEGIYRKTFTDYLDDVSTVHPDKSTWDPTSPRFLLSDRKPELGLSPYETGAKRGEPNKKDSYWTFNVRVEYYLPNNFIFGNNPQRNLYKMKRKAYNKQQQRLRKRR